MKKLVTPEDTYQEYVALKSHFTGSYDYMRYSGKTKPPGDMYRKNKLFFEKVSKHKNAKRFLLANILDNPKVFIRTLAYSQEAEERFTKYDTKMQMLTYQLKSDMKKMNDDLKSNFSTKDGHPPIVVLYLRNDICLETLCIFLSCFPQVEGRWKAAYEYDPVMTDLLFKIKKYNALRLIDYHRYKETIKLEFEDR